MLEASLPTRAPRAKPRPLRRALAHTRHRMPRSTRPRHTAAQRILVLGEGRLIDVVRRVLDDVAADVIHLRAPTDREIRRALTPTSTRSS